MITFKSKILITLLTFSNYIYSQDYGDIIVTEIMFDPSCVSDAKGEYFEIYNTTNEDINLDSWVFKDLGSNEIVVDEELVISPKQFFVFGKNAELSSNGGVSIDYEYGSKMTLVNSGDAIIVENSGGTEVSRVVYNKSDGWQMSAGAAIEFEGCEFDQVNDPNFWGVSTLSTECGDLGTPGVINSNASLLLDKSLAFDGLTLQSNEIGADYQWFTCDGTRIDGENTVSIEVTDVELYKVLLSNAQCEVFSDCSEEIVISSVNHQNSQIKLYPNPSNGDFTISFGSLNVNRVEIISTEGQIVMDQIIDSVDVIDSSGLELEAGMYFVKINAKNYTEILKLVLE